MNSHRPDLSTNMDLQFLQHKDSGSLNSLLKHWQTNNMAYPSAFAPHPLRIISPESLEALWASQGGLPASSFLNQTAGSFYPNLLPVIRPLDEAQLIQLQAAQPLLQHLSNASIAKSDSLSSTFNRVAPQNGSDHWWSGQKNTTMTSNGPVKREPTAVVEGSLKRSHSAELTQAKEQNVSHEHSSSKRKRKNRQNVGHETSTIAPNGTVRTLLQTADAEDHFKKSLQCASIKVASTPDGTLTSDQKLEETLSEPGVILDSVDAHFEKSLAAFLRPTSSANDLPMTLGNCITTTSSGGITGKRSSSQRSYSTSVVTDDDRFDILRTLDRQGSISSARSTPFPRRLPSTSQSSSTSCSPESHMGDEDPTTLLTEDNSFELLHPSTHQRSKNPRHKSVFKPKQAWLRQYDDRAPPILEKASVAPSSDK